MDISIGEQMPLKIAIISGNSEIGKCSLYWPGWPIAVKWSNIVILHKISGGKLFNENAFGAGLLGCLNHYKVMSLFKLCESSLVSIEQTYKI